jgi:hypothetical protein
VSRMRGKLICEKERCWFKWLILEIYNIFQYQSLQMQCHI